MWKKGISLALAVLLAAAAAGCSGTGSLAAQTPAREARPSSARRAVRFVETTPVPVEEIAPRPTFSIEPVEIREVATPVPVFATSTPEPEEEIYEPVVPDEEDMHPQQEPVPAPAEAFSGRTVSVRYYDMENQQPEEIPYTVPMDASPNVVVAVLSDALSDLLAQQGIRINATSYTDGDLYVDFDPAIYSLGLASADENQILQSIADTYLVNVDGIRAVYYTVGGESYHSEHTQLEGNEPYKELLGARG